MIRLRSLGLAGLLSVTLAAPAFSDGPCPYCGGYHGGAPAAPERRKEAEAATARGREIMDTYRAAEKESREAYARGASERVREIEEQAAALRTVPDKVPRPALTELSDAATKVRLQELALQRTLNPPPPAPRPAWLPPGARLQEAPDPSMAALMGKELSRQRRALADAVESAKKSVTAKVEAAKERVAAPVRTVKEKIEELRQDLDNLGKE